MSEKKKMQPNRKGNLLIFALLWLIILGALKYIFFRNSFESDIFIFVNNYAPGFFLKRLWLFYLLEGLGFGLFIGASQKLALSFLNEAGLKYWLRATTIAAVAASMIFYLYVRFYLHMLSYMLIEPFFVSLSFTLIGLSQWLILRKHFRHAWLWLLPIVPSIFLENMRWDLPQPMMVEILQAVMAIAALGWISRQNISEEKQKNVEAAESRLSDNLPDEDEIQSSLVQYQASES